MNPKKNGAAPVKLGGVLCGLYLANLLFLYSLTLLVTSVLALGYLPDEEFYRKIPKLERILKKDK